MGPLTVARSGDAFDHRRVRVLFARAEEEVDAGRLPSCQVAVARGPAIVTAAFGSATAESRYVLFSLTKTLVAGAVWALMSDGLLRADTVVADVIPEFAANGKQDVTVEHLLTHTGGFPDAALQPEEAQTSAGRTAAFARWELAFAPGTAFAYHPGSAHWVLAEIIERISGGNYRRFVHDRVTGPLRLDGLRLGVPLAEQDDILEVQAAGASDEADAGDDWWMAFNEPEVLAAGVPGVGGVGSATHLARYFQFLLHGAPQVWSASVLAAATRTVRCDLVHPQWGVSANRSLGLVVAGADGSTAVRNFGSAVGPATFGHTGAGGQMVWADPDSGLSFCFLTNGMAADQEAIFERGSALSTLAAGCAASV